MKSARIGLSCFLLVVCSDQIVGLLRAQEEGGFKYIEITVVDPDDNPVPGAAVEVSIDGMQFPMPSNGKGKLSLNVPSGPNSRLNVQVKHEDYASVGIFWQGSDTIPSEYTLKLSPGVQIGGIVQDEEGQPIEGVKVEGATLTNSSGVAVLRPQLGGELATTDKAGRWQITTADDHSLTLMLKLSHEDFLSTDSYDHQPTWQQLRSLEHVLQMKKGIQLHGKVVDTEGTPIVGALISLGSDRYMVGHQQQRTDAEGKYHFRNVEAGAQLATICALGKAPEMQLVEIQKDIEPVDFTLQSGKTIKVRVTDPDGLPLAGIGIAGDDWRGNRTLPNEIYRGTTDEKGIWQCDSMPDDQVSFDLFARGQMSSRDNGLTAREEPHTIVMQWPLLVTGKVVDAESGLPIEKFQVVRGIFWGSGNEQIHWERYNLIEGRDGKYEIEFTEPRAGHHVRIEAPGYRPGVSRLLKNDEGEVRVNFSLEEGKGPSGIVKTPAGQPAEGATLHIAIGGEGLYFHDGLRESNRQTPNANTAADGTFALPFLDDRFELVCLHESGWAQLDQSQLVDEVEIQLQPFSIVEGKVVEGSTPLANENVVLHFNDPYERDAPRVYWSYSAITDGAGKFRFERVVRSDATVARTISFADYGNGGSMSTYSHSENVKLQPGKVTHVQLGGSGRTVFGQLKTPEHYKQPVLWRMGCVQLWTNNQRTSGGFFHELGRLLAGGGAQPTQPQATRRSYGATIDEEGHFRVADVEPGNYTMHVQLHEVPLGGNPSWNDIGTLHTTITVPAATAEENEAIDLGEFTLTMREPQTSATVTGANLRLFVEEAPADEAEANSDGTKAKANPE